MGIESLLKRTQNPKEMELLLIRYRRDPWLMVLDALVLFLLASTLALLVGETGDREKTSSLSNSLDIEHIVTAKIMETVTNEHFYCISLILQVVGLASTLLQLVGLTCLLAEISLNNIRKN
jgi:hypothetical protein